MTSPADRLIVALDGEPNEMEILVGRLRGVGVNFFKLGIDALLQPRGRALADGIASFPGFSLFLDLKLYDTRDTVDRTVRRAFDLGARFVTVHATPSVMEAAMRTKPSGDRCKVLAVGPTSDQSYESYNRWLENAPIELCDGVVCPAAFVHRWASYLRCHDKIVVCPGVRPLTLARDPGGFEYIDERPDDHATVTSPRLAIEQGAGFLVVGRPICAAPDPVAAARAILAEIEGAIT
jgi:orotidine-5'-phosphate decarboxylase